MIKKFVLVLALLLVYLVAADFAYAENKSDHGFIYGEISMRGGDTYRGPIRWGREEALWHDMFNSTKDDNKYSDYLSNKDLREIRKHSERREGVGGFLKRLFGDDDYNDSDILPIHQFVCRFGEIKKIKMWGNSTVLLTMKDGERIEVKGGSNDINAKIHIIDQKEGELTLKWKKIRVIEFMPAPQPLKKKFGEPLYGTVKTSAGKFKGFIQWDHQECLDTDELDGDFKGKDMSIKFGEIKSIEKHRRGSLVTVNSGEEYYLTGTNDVNDDNKGIVINDLHFGKIRVDWDEFIGVAFEKNAGAPIAGYDDFVSPKKLSGTVETRAGKTYTGRIVYDIDEAMDFELIGGYYEDVKYVLPIRNIDTIVPSGRCCSRITMKNGKAVELEDERDVNKDNSGLLVWENDEPVYIPWREIRTIKFN
ncbi:MAG: hypothetical protein GY950_32590 [bacterium]|nr:hypothetical protein [bacterium]